MFEPLLHLPFPRGGLRWGCHPLLCVSVVINEEKAMDEVKKPHLIFSERELFYAVDAISVKEMFYLPELALVADAPRYLAGTLNLRGTLIKVIDMDMFFGHSPRRYTASTCVVVLEQGNRHAAIIADDVVDVGGIGEPQMAPSLQASAGKPAGRPLVLGEADAGDRVAMVLSSEALFALAEDAEASPPGPEHEGGYFIDGCPAEERELFRQRKADLSAPLEVTAADAALWPVALFTVHGEYYGAELDTVLEITEYEDIVPVPCTPRHVLGDINLRGTILTVIDISGILNIQSPSTAGLKKALVAEHGGERCGIAAEDVLDVLYLKKSEFTPFPAGSQVNYEKCMKGTVRYGQRAIVILDIPKILSLENLAVNEEVG